MEEQRLLGAEGAMPAANPLYAAAPDLAAPHPELLASAPPASAPPASEEWKIADMPPQDFARSAPQTATPVLPTPSLDVAAFTLDDARVAVEAWVQNKTFFRARDFIRSAQVTDFKTFNAFVATLETFVEYRKLSPGERPYRGGMVDSGMPVGAWDVVRPPKEYFKNDHFHMVLPHSERVDRCHHCHGRGTRQCLSCRGGGTQQCLTCMGRGLVEHTHWVTDNRGHRRAERHNDRCNSCAGTGWRQCITCIGRGVVTCSRCEGTGQLVLFTRLKIEFKNVVTEAVVKEAFDPALTAALPNERLSGAGGPCLLAEQAWTLNPSAGVQGRINPQVNTAIDRLLAEARANEPRVQHQQRLIVRGLPVYQLTYLDGGAPERLWIIGTDRKVYAPHYPISVPRVTLVTLGVFLLVAAIVFLIVYFAYLKPNHIL